MQYLDGNTCCEIFIDRCIHFWPKSYIDNIRVKKVFRHLIVWYIYIIFMIFFFD